jgi:ABC-type branched-subunit amino acid transport system substrate-binding protein
MLRPALGLFASALLLSACVAEGPAAPPPVRTTVAPPPAQPQGPRPVALLLPLSGPNAAIANAMREAAQLAASTPGAPPLDIRDTGGDPARAGIAAQGAIEAGDAMILGPLTAEETQAVAGVAVPANIPVLAFSSDPSVAAPGVWTLGITPGQQMRRLVAAARAEGRQHLAALLPEGAFGDALQTALVDAASQAGFEPPNIQRGGTAPDATDAALKALTDYETRRGAVEERIRAMRESTDPASRQQAAILAAQPAAPPPFDTLVLGANGDPLRAIADKLLTYDVVPPQVRVLGPSFWASGAAQTRKLAGAWYAVPDPTERSGFVSAFVGKYGATPPPIADIAFDAVLIARSLAQDHDVSANALTKPDGFSGVDGAIVLQPDGHVRRALAIFQIGGGGTGVLVSAAPSDLSVPGS